VPCLLLFLYNWIISFSPDIYSRYFLCFFQLQSVLYFIVWCGMFFESGVNIGVVGPPWAVIFYYIHFIGSLLGWDIFSGRWRRGVCWIYSNFQLDGLHAYKKQSVAHCTIEHAEFSSCFIVSIDWISSIIGPSKNILLKAEFLQHGNPSFFKLMIFASANELSTWLALCGLIFKVVLNHSVNTCSLKCNIIHSCFYM